MLDKASNPSHQVPQFTIVAAEPGYRQLIVVLHAETVDGDWMVLQDPLIVSDAPVVAWRVFHQDWKHPPQAIGLWPESKYTYDMDTDSPHNPVICPDGRVRDSKFGYPDFTTWLNEMSRKLVERLEAQSEQRRKKFEFDRQMAAEEARLSDGEQ